MPSFSSIGALFCTIISFAVAKQQPIDNSYNNIAAYCSNSAPTSIHPDIQSASRLVNGQCTIGAYATKGGQQTSTGKYTWHWMVFDSQCNTIGGGVSTDVSYPNVCIPSELPASSMPCLKETEAGPGWMWAEIIVNGKSIITGPTRAESSPSSNNVAWECGWKQNAWDSDYCLTQTFDCDNFVGSDQPALHPNF